MVVGVISDTHGLVRAAVHEALAGSYLILHAGDVCGDDVLTELSTIAPVAAVMGNCDPPGHPRLPTRIDREIGGHTFHVSHGHELGVPRPAGLLAAYDASVIVFGHTHRPLVHRSGGRLVLNPGAAGPRRFDILPSVARLTITSEGIDVAIVELPIDSEP
ncbi:MAG: metallophosphoesterase family protein [Gemmatimonadaceae bacterium]|nr:metallophosphoesterase family protein [Gemmatimonadaceae bacterium]